MSRQGSALIVFHGDVSIRAAEATRQRLREALGANDSLEIDFADVEEVDLTFLQLLLSAQLSGQRDGKRVFLSRPAEGAVRAALLRAGFLGEQDRSSAGYRFWEAVRE